MNFRYKDDWDSPVGTVGGKISADSSCIWHRLCAGSRSSESRTRTPSSLSAGHASQTLESVNKFVREYLPLGGRLRISCSWQHSGHQSFLREDMHSPTSVACRISWVGARPPLLYLRPCSILWDGLRLPCSPVLPFEEGPDTTSPLRVAWVCY